ncbi:heme ABC transporter ATP-binding protein [Nisaea nitritireducens]|uniref:heme ABC transporter ATP-binding protein n=1 Tax=Nisaea nitritireducens TaxID=568392 RepID=UPI001868679D|nr:heme ABC transporter ATP-binding protein [Nisaea nitritireducens]
MLEAQGITVSFGKTTVLRDVSLRVRPGELVALCGPNGAGKSTLLAAMAGDFQPERGQVFIEGAIITGLPPAELARRRAVLEQSPSLSAGFSVGELLALSIPRDVPPEQADALIARKLHSVGLADRIGDNCQILSGGQRHRAHLARVLVQLAASDTPDTGYLMLDEPTSSLDIAHQITTMRIARRAAREGAGVLVVLHDLNLAAAFADRVALMHDGRMVADGPGAKIFTADRLSAIYETEIAVEREDGQAPRILPVYGPDAHAGPEL